MQSTKRAARNYWCTWIKFIWEGGGPQINMPGARWRLKIEGAALYGVYGQHRFVFMMGGGGVIGVLGEGANRPSGGSVWEGVSPAHGIGTFSKIRVSKSHFRMRAFKNDFLGNST